MRSSLRTALGAVLTTTVVLSVLAPALTTPASAEVPPAPAAPAAPAAAAPTEPEQYTPAEATAILTRLQQALAPKKRPAARAGVPVPRTDLSLLMQQAKAARGAMTARQISIYEDAVEGWGRPVADSTSCSRPFLSPWEVLEGARFCIHYRPGLSYAAGGAQATDALATLRVMDQVYAKQVTSLGFRPPVADKDGKFDVFLDQLGDQGLYGFCFSDRAARVTTAWCGLDNDFREFNIAPNAARQVTAAHEFFHAVQYAYDAGDHTAFMEGTAAWAEEQVYPAVNDYLQYLNASQLRSWKQSTDYIGGLHRYSSVIFWKFLSERYKSPALIRRIWELAAAPGRNGFQSTALALKERGASFPAEFARYGVWNTLPPGTYSDRGRFPLFRDRSCNNRRWCTWTTRTLSTKTRSTGNLAVRLNHLVTAPLLVRPGSSLPARSRLTVRVDGPDTVRGSQARVQVRYKNGKVSTYTIVLNRAGNGAKTVTFNPKRVSQAVVTLSNGSLGWNQQLFKVRATASY